MSIGYNRINYCLRAFTIVFLLSLPATLQAQKKEPFDIRLKTTTLHPAANAKSWLKQSGIARQGEVVQKLVQFQTIPTSEQKEQLRERGIILQDYVNGNAFTALIRSSANESLANDFPIRSIIDIQPEWKAESFFWKRVDAAPMNEIEVTAAFYKNVNASDIRGFVMSIGGTIEKTDLEKLHLFKIKITASKLRELAAWYGIRYISPAPNYTPLDVEANGADGIPKVNAPISLGGYNLNGDGVVIGIGDNSTAVTHIDIQDRVIDYNPAPYADHGLNTSSMAGSAGIVDPKAAGVLPHATIVNHFYDFVIANTGIIHDEHNVTITNNSYANYVNDTNFSGLYDVYAQTLDELSLQYPDVLHVFAAGNDGFLIRPSYPDGYGTITGGYQPAKNNITVSNNSKLHVNRYNSSRGPVNDGRLKPELSAIGNEVLVAKEIDGYMVIQGGTSMASPQGAGVAGLLTERYRQINGNVNPRSDLLKALILNGTNDIGNTGPDFCFGFGFLNANRSREMLDSTRYQLNTIANNGQQSFNVTVPAGLAQFKVMLCWNDKEASLMSPVQLVNDLDVEVEEPNTTVHKPLILTTNRPDVLNLAVEGKDSLNNTEQVIVNNPPAGNYTIRIKGYDIPVGAQPYAVTYDFVQQGIQFKNPANGAAVATGDSMCIYWEASEDPNPFTIEYSDNNGGSWNTLSNSIPPAQRYFIWYVPNISSEQVRLRITRNTTAMVAVSDTIVVAPQPVVKLDSSAMCPGYIKIHWSPIPNATGYIVMRKAGFYMQPVATINDTTYTFSGLSVDSNYYIAVQPLINGRPGYRSMALKRKPADGNCANSMSDGDLMVERIVSPSSGRQQTSSQLTNNETMTVRVRNLDNVAISNYTLWYAVNGVWNSQSGTNLAANTTTDVNITGINLSAANNYVLQAVIQNDAATDNVSNNDSATKIVRQLVNAPVSLVTTFTENFEAFGIIKELADTMGLSPDERWDFTTDLVDTGRLRSHINDSFLVTGNRSMTMDQIFHKNFGAQNYLTATYNFAAMDTASDEVRTDFDYIVHGNPKYYDGNEVWVRGNDQAPWVSVYHYDTTGIGTVHSSGSLSLTQALKSAGQNFSSSTQIRYGQKDTALVGARDFGNGTTLDNVRLYILQQDVQLLGLLLPEKALCGAGQDVPVMIRVFNSVSQAQSNTQVSYQLDNGPVVTETIASIAGYDTIDYTFNQLIAALPFGNHTINVWLSAPGDQYLSNDSVLNTPLYRQPLVNTFPFLEDFETNNGFWYQEGDNSTWEYGTPSALIINSAFSGTKAWKTNLDGYYNNQELSYLYTGCFDISALDSPILHFKLNMDIENCGATLCDAAYMEYTYDNSNWTKLGTSGQGTNWYNFASANVWNRQDSVVWRDAIYPLPQSSQPIRFRYVFSSDAGTTREGIAIDDFRIYNYVDTTTPPPPPVENFDGLAVGPNPSDGGFINIKWSSVDSSDLMQVAIFDVAGRLVFRQDYTKASGLSYPGVNNTINVTTVKTGRFMTGIYVVKIIIDDRHYYKKVLFH
jgi:hypothetical protein